MDLNTIGTAFVVVVVGGMGSMAGAFFAALLIAELKALCVWIGLVPLLGVEVSFSKLTLVVEFLVMAVVLVLRPWGLLGRALAAPRHAAATEVQLHDPGIKTWAACALLMAGLLLLPALTDQSSYALVLAIDLLVAVLFATSLHFIMGPGGMHSFGHAAYFGLAAYASALLVRRLGLPMEAAILLGPIVSAMFAMLLGWFAVRLSGVYLAMLTLAFSQIVWAVVFQWDSVTGGSNGLTGVWPAPWLADQKIYYLLTLLAVGLGVAGLWRVLFSPFGQALRAGRDSALRADAIGIDVKRVQWIAFIIAGAIGGMAGSLFAFSKGSISPEGLHVSRSIDALVMVLLGGVQTLVGPVVGAISFTWLHDTVARNTDYWRAVLGGIILLLVLLFPQGIAGQLRHWAERLRYLGPEGGR